ncbi:hypothetical protein [Halomonas heilongjiangensis]|uniref:Uncharacterized protein n=1 Tax=Halomonas heilongjiangensis TaxID=1387883 RepID=A0A2N7TU41_9GAMM|nr:hypothetical protein [Halomonas heilongjiangensis]PMR71700.1 hypothetical protein C1H66_01290 [Halomonas heilongjiangensis]PXX89426.1 hypothetical protein CR158_10775 [Halomonas heilongjiangensis]
MNTINSATRISEAKLSTIDPSSYNVIGVIARCQVLESDPTYVEVKPDRRLPPIVSRDHPGTDMTPAILLIEVDDPENQATLERLKAELGL